MFNPFEDQDAFFFALVNSKSQYSLWPEFLAVPAGWDVSCGPAPRTEIVAHIESVWRDLRPTAVRIDAGVPA